MDHKKLSAKYVIFGTGPLGMSVMDALLERDETNITLVNRHGDQPETLPPGVKIASGDATDSKQVEDFCNTAETVFHCAQPGYTAWPEKFPPITKGILDGVSNTQAKLVFGDNLYMYGQVEGPIHEGLAYRAEGRKGKTRAAMATMLLEAHRAGKVQIAIGRGSDFFGPRVTGSAMGEMVFNGALQGKAVNFLGDIDQPHTYTYIKDFGRALVVLGSAPEALGQAWHVPNDQAMTTREFVRLIEAALGKPVKTRVSGRGMLTLLGLFIPDLREMKEMMYEFEAPYVVDSDKFTKQFNLRPTPLKEAVSETLAWYRGHSNGAR